MASLKMLLAVAHDVGHHAQSSLSFLHPHLGQACRQAGVNEAHIELMAESPYPAELPPYEPLAMAFKALRQRFFEIVERYRLLRSDVAGVRLSFTFRTDRRDDYLCAVRTVLTARTGRQYEQSIPFIGEAKPRSER